MPILHQAIEELALGPAERPTVIFNGAAGRREDLLWLRKQGMHRFAVRGQPAPIPSRTAWYAAPTEN